MRNSKRIIGMVAVCIMILASFGGTHRVNAAQKKTATLVVKNCNVNIQQGTSSQFEIQYNADKIKVTETGSDDKTFTFEKASKWVRLGTRDNVIIKLPADISNYEVLNIVGEGGGVGVNGVDAKLNVQMNGGAFSLTTLKSISKDVDCKLNGGVGSFTFYQNSNFDLHFTRTNCNCSMSTRFPGNRNSNDYRHTFGNGTAKVNIDAVNCTMSMSLK